MLKIPYLLFLLVFPLVAAAQVSGAYYNDGHGNKVLLPLGDVSFADEVVSFMPGNPSAIAQSSVPSAALGRPDFDNVNKGFVSLGCGGQLVMRFRDNALVDIPGPDLFVFEVGKFIESTLLYISKDGNSWLLVDTLAGAKAEVDIAGVSKPGDVFNYVKLVDLKTECRGRWAGADIDAIAAIGTAKRYLLDCNIIFKVNESDLKPEAQRYVDSIAVIINSTAVKRVVVEGYTDSIGTAQLNYRLSMQRALAVENYLKKKVMDKKIKFTVTGFGAKNPLLPNNSAQNRAKNRRVEIMLLHEE